MLTEFFRPAELTTRQITETTFVIERKVTEKASLFVEYVGDYPENARPSQLFNSGGAYLLTPTQQLDFHVAFGLNHNAPNYRRCRLFVPARWLVRGSAEITLRHSGARQSREPGMTIFKILPPASSSPP